MEDPVKEIPGVIHLLTQSPPSVQSATVEKYFTPTASFSHPFCRTGSWWNSRWAIGIIYRWYKIMSPRIDITVQSVALDEANLTLYIRIFQIFRIWAVPLYYAPVRFTTLIVLHHSPRDNKYYIQSQDDLYQIEEWIKFILPGFWVFVLAWQFMATGFCWIGTLLLAPITWIEENWGWEQGKKGEVEYELREREWGAVDGLSVDEVLQKTDLRKRFIG